MPARIKKARRESRLEVPLDAIPVSELAPPAPRSAATPAAEKLPSSTSPAVNDACVPGIATHAQLEAEADRLANVAPGTFLYGILAGYFGSALDKHSYIVFLQRLVAQMSPADPLEAMLIEQITLTHHAIGRAHVKAANGGNADAAAVYYSAAARLQAEFRKSLVAWKTIHPTAPPSSVVIEKAQQPQTKEFGAGDEASLPSLFANSELGSKPHNRLKELFDELTTARS